MPYQTIATVISAGNGSRNRQYKYVHKLPGDGNNFYRLRMNDTDGRFTCSPVLKIKITVNKIKVTVLPNPVERVMNLNIQSPQNETLVLYLQNTDGKVVSAKTFTIIKGNNRVSWSLPYIASGVLYISSEVT